MQQADWDELKEQMNTPYGSMKLKCDGFDVELVQVIQAGKKSWGTTVYVNGYIRGMWLNCDNKTGATEHEETRRFYRKITRGLYTPKQLEALRKIWGKREADKRAAQKFITYDWTWKNFTSLKRHLQANNTSIERLH
ncbi:Uncharacterised protein [Pseudomonas putida]|nr:Uncharacterised protein [Pseudomonas putida]CAB5661057.1 Uncharacterised protein [Pseudomonas putida]CAB5686737.1 Uncharacterised protein [Pseudomonas putida]CAB5699626.1 Uncharacterised protein [Pseudomonas putida]CAC9680907.1 Uncharacterised protein [Pseudomonas putida]